MAQLNAATNKKQITGMTMFYLCAWHTITIGEAEKNVYMVMADDNLIKGIPGFYDLVAEFIKTLREFNGKTDAFKLAVASAKVMDSPIDYIDNPVVGAQESDFGCLRNIASDEHPYAGGAAKAQELKNKAMSAQDDNDEWGIKVLPDATLGICYYKGSKTEITVPEEIDGLKVTRICEFTFSPINVFSSNKVTSLMKSITEIHLPESIKVIEDHAICDCPELKKIVFPKGECKIYAGVLNGCEKIEDVIIVNNGTTLYRYPASLTDKEYTVPEGVTAIAEKAFPQNGSLRDIYLSENISDIGYNAFGTHEGFAINFLADDPSDTGKKDYKINIHAPEQSYVEHYVKEQNDERLVFVANGVASVPYEEDDGSDFDLSSLLGLLGLGG